jgi:hypothetical protein
MLRADGQSCHCIPRALRAARVSRTAAPVPGSTPEPGMASRRRAAVLTAFGGGGGAGPMPMSASVLAGRVGWSYLTWTCGTVGDTSLEALEATYDRLPPTLTARSGGGGKHLYFLYPGRHIPNSAQLGGFSGLDVRADGGYIVAPPSLHQSGQHYAWEGLSHPVAALPRWLCDLLTPPGRSISGGPPRSRVSSSSEAEARWLRLALERARPGTRNVTGYWLACRLRDAGVSQGAAEVVLLRYAAQVPTGDHPYQDREALASLRFAYQSPALYHRSASRGA